MKTRLRLFSVSLCLCGLLSAAEPVRYTISLKDPAKHFLHVTLRLPAAGPFVLELPVWNATYQVRDFAQYVEGVRASGKVRRLNTHAWRIEPLSSEAEVSYEIFADMPGPFGFQLNEGHAFLNMALCLMYRADARDAPVELRFTDVPAGWKIGTALPEKDGVFQARNYDHLADSPVEIAAFQEVILQEGRTIYRVVAYSEPKTPQVSQLRKLGDIVEKIVTYETALMRDTPFETYTFLYEFRPRAGGGMEHAFSTAIGSSWPDEDAAWERLAGVTAHEFFHLWNVKRIRPQSLEPVDYTQEQPTRALWFSEGFTSTYGAYTLLRTGLTTPRRFLESLERGINGFEKHPAARRQTVEESSLETWFDKYPYYRRPERSISYYQKGELIGYLLDLAIRQATQNRRSLDDLMRLMNERYVRNHLFFAEDRDIQRTAEEIAGQSFQEFFDTLVRSAASVDYARYLGYAGFAFEEKEIEAASLGFTAFRNFDGPLQVVAVDPQGPAAKSALRAGDQIVEINGRPPARSLEESTARIKPGETVRLRFERNGARQETSFIAGRVRERAFKISEIPSSTPLQQKIRQGWLEGKTE